MAFPPIKSVLLILAAISQRVGINPPNPPPTKEDRAVNGGNQFFEKFARRLIGPFIQLVGIGTVVIESAIILALSFQNTQSMHILSAICPSTTEGLPPLSSLSTLSPRFLLGVSLIYGGTLIRVWCYKALGTLFTYELTIRPNHKLITSGPYAFVRHPSYTASVFLMLGAALTVFDTHAYVQECGLMETNLRWVLVVWRSLLGYTVVSLLRRGGVEDTGLEREFGASWQVYKQKVPCRFVPNFI